MSTSHCRRVYSPGPPHFSFLLSLELNMRFIDSFDSVVEFECEYYLSAWTALIEELLCIVLYYSSWQRTLKVTYSTFLFYRLITWHPRLPSQVERRQDQNRLLFSLSVLFSIFYCLLLFQLFVYLTNVKTTLFLMCFVSRFQISFPPNIAL